jgi:alpha-L-fucosidase
MLILLVLSALPASADPAVRIREDFLSLKLGMSIHYSVATHHDRQWATGTEDSAAFKPDKRDCNQWLHAAAAAAMKYAVLTV